MGLKLITPPAAEPLTLAQAKSQLRIPASITTYDEDVGDALAAARAYIENITRNCLINQTWDQTFDEFPSAAILLRKYPVQSIVGLYYFDELGAEQTIAAENFYLDNTSDYHWLVPNSAYVWPETLDAINSIRIRMLVGHGADKDDIPPVLVQAVRLSLNNYYGMIRRDITLSRDEIPGLGSRSYTVSSSGADAVDRLVTNLVQEHVVYFPE
jgi:uncharacterized phiE125 gp8 family phage protein